MKHPLCSLAGALESSVGDGDLKSSETDGDSRLPSEEPHDQLPAVDIRVDEPRDTSLSAVKVLVDADVDGVDGRCSEESHVDTLIRVTDQSSYCPPPAADAGGTVLPAMRVPLASCTDP